MQFIKEKVEAGVLDLSVISINQLIQWSQETNSLADKDFLGTEIMYRSE